MQRDLLIAKMEGVELDTKECVLKNIEEEMSRIKIEENRLKDDKKILKKLIKKLDKFN